MNRAAPEAAAVSHRPISSCKQLTCSPVGLGPAFGETLGAGVAHTASLRAATLAVGETVILRTSPPHHHRSNCDRERGVQPNDSLGDG